MYVQQTDSSRELYRKYIRSNEMIKFDNIDQAKQAMVIATVFELKTWKKANDILHEFKTKHHIDITNIYTQNIDGTTKQIDFHELVVNVIMHILNINNNVCDPYSFSCSIMALDRNAIRNTYSLEWCLIGLAFVYLAFFKDASNYIFKSMAMTVSKRIEKLN